MIRIYSKRKVNLIRTAPNSASDKKNVLRSFPVSDHYRYMPQEETCEEPMSDIANKNITNTEEQNPLPTPFEVDEEQQQITENKVCSRSKYTFGKWIREWNSKRYNLIFAEVFGLYFLIMSAIFVSDYYSLPLYIIVTFAIPYVIYFAIKHFVEYKKSKLNNNEE